MQAFVNCRGIDEISVANGARNVRIDCLQVDLWRRPRQIHFFRFRVDRSHSSNFPQRLTQLVATPLNTHASVSFVWLKTLLIDNFSYLLHSMGALGTARTTLTHLYRRPMRCVWLFLFHIFQRIECILFHRTVHVCTSSTQHTLSVFRIVRFY